MRKFYEDNKVLIDRILFLAIVIVILYLLLNTIFGYIAPFVFGYLLSLILNPLVRLIQRYIKVGRGFASVLSILIMFAVVGVLTTGIVSRIFAEAQAFFANLPDVIEYATSTLNDLYIRFNQIYNVVPPQLHEFLEEVTATLASTFTSMLGSGIKSGSTNIVAKVPNFLLGFVLCIVSSYFFMKDRHTINTSVSAIIPEYFKANYAVMKSGVLDALLGYVKAQGILMSLVYVIVTTGMVILRVPYALFLGILIAIVDALPVFGSGFFYWPWIAFSLLTGEYSMAIGLGIIYICVLLTRQILEPKVLGRQIGIHPLLTLMSIYIGLRVFGVFGIFIGPCILVIVKAVLEAPVIVPERGQEGTVTSNGASDNTL